MVLASILVPFWEPSGILFPYFFGIDFRMPFWMPKILNKSQLGGFWSDFGPKAINRKGIPDVTFSDFFRSPVSASIFESFWWNFYKILEKVWLEIRKTWGNFEKLAREKNVEIVDLVKGFPTHIWLQKSASIQPENGPVKVCERKNGAQVTKKFVRVTKTIDANIGPRHLEAGDGP